MKPLHTLLWLILLFVITFTLIVPLLCISLPFSKFYYLYNKQDDITKKAELLNSERYKKSLAYISSLHSESSKLFYLNMKKSGHLDLVVAIITVKRKDGTLGYLTQSVAKMDKLLKEDRNFERKFMFICNVDQNLYGHEEARNLEKFIPVEYRFKNSSVIHQSSPHKVLYHLHKNFDTYQKETIDYMFCLEMAYSMNPDYVLLVEDDTLPLPMALDVLTTKLRWLTLFRSEPMKNYAFIKLYYPPKWQGFGNEIRRILEVIAIGMVGGGCFFIFAIRKKIFTQYLYFVLGAIYFIIFALLLDRQNVLELRRLASQLYSLNISPGCCTPAMFYPKWIIPSLLNYLANDNNKHHTDIAIYNFITSNNLTAYQVEPNLFAHVGMYTSVHQNSRKDPQEFIFSM